MKLVIKGQVRGGKNNYMVTRQGNHVPRKSFIEWSNSAIAQLLSQPHYKITEPCSLKINYISGDKRQRDVPAIIDAVFHVLERSGIVSDDCLIGALGHKLEFFHGGYDKQNPLIELVF